MGEQKVQKREVLERHVADKVCLRNFRRTSSSGVLACIPRSAP